MADVPDSKDKYLAVFNISEDDKAKTNVALKDLGFKKKVNVTELWSGKELGEFKDGFSPEVETHGAGMYRISPQK